MSIGNFDGVHRGHAVLIDRLVTAARRRSVQAVVFTFEPHPAQLLRPEAAPIPLTWLNRKSELLGELGVDLVLAYPTDRRILQYTAEQFFQEIVIEQLAASQLVEGHDFCFGKNRSGNLEVLAQLCDVHQVELDVVTPVTEADETVSSSRVRKLIATGQVAAANALLTQPYRLRGCVTTGARRARQLGFPTANLAKIETLIPAPGVYAGRAHPVGSAQAGFAAALNIGPSPTFADPDQKVEVHLIDYDGDLYGTELTVDFLDRLRDIQTFETVAQLQSQLNADVMAARQVCAGGEIR